MEKGPEISISMPAYHKALDVAYYIAAREIADWIESGEVLDLKHFINKTESFASELTRIAKLLNRLPK